MTNRLTLIAFAGAYTAFIVVTAASSYIDNPDFRLLQPVLIACVLAVGGIMKPTGRREDER